LRGLSLHGRDIAIEPDQRGDPEPTPLASGPRNCGQLGSAAAAASANKQKARGYNQEMPAVVYILFGAGLTIAASISAGKLLLRSVKLLDRGEHIVFSFLLGSALLSMLVFVLCAASLARKGVFLAAGVLLVAAASRVHWRALPRRPRVPSPWKVLLIVIGATYGVLYFFNALAPEISPDGSTYHLGLAASYLREHGFHRITNDLHASFSQGIEMLFLFAFAFGRHSAASMLHFAFLPALAAMMILYARRAGMVEAGVCAALFIIASPIFGVDATSAYNDVATASIVFGVFYLLEIWDAERSAWLAIPIGLLAGFAYAAKFTAAIAIPYSVGFVTWRSWRMRQSFLRPTLTICACAFLMMVPWMAKNWLWVANPFSPFFNGLFPNPYIQVGFEKELGYHMRHYDGIRSNAELPWAVMGGGQLSGFLGPLFLLAPVGLVALRWPAGRRLLLAAAVFGSTYFFNVGARFLMPAVVFLALAMAMVFARRPFLALSMVLLHAVVSWPSVASLYCESGAWRLHEIPVRAALRLDVEDRYLAAHLPNYNMARLIERVVPPSGKVLSFSGVAEAYTARDILVVYQSAENKVLGEILWTPLVPSYMPNRMLVFDIPRDRLRSIKVVQTGSGTGDWSITDLRVIPPVPVARVHAAPNPWETPLALDGKAVTRWRTWLPLMPGQFFEMDFGNAQPVERVTVQCTRDQPAINLVLEAEDASGRWKTLAATEHEREIAPIPDLRRRSAEELKRRGVTHLLVFGSDYGSEDFRLRAAEWGIRQAGELGNDRLYEID
jgi:4-amino-4-deoxy-L-arabinose transferase-like glycosyltransferase